MAERKLLVARERPLQPCSRLFRCARSAFGIKSLSNFRQRVEAREERQIVRRDPPERQASRPQLICAAYQGHVENSLLAIHLTDCSATINLQ